MTSRESHDILERRVLELLPWYVNDTLQGDERELVSRQVLASLTCRKELERLRRLQDLIRSDATEAAATSRAFERLMTRIETSGVRPRARGLWGAYADWFAYAAVLVAAASMLWWWNPGPTVAPPEYETMSRSQQPDSQTATVRVVFAAGVTESQRQELLSSLGLIIVGSPTADGVFTLSIVEAANRHAIEAALRQDSRIRLVTTAPGTGGP